MEGVVCNPTEDCKYYPSCYQDSHHVYFPRRDYKTKIEKQFRNLPENLVEMCRLEHDNLHATQTPPEKPSRDEMLVAISRTALGEVA